MGPRCGDQRRQPVIASGEVRTGPGGSRYRGDHAANRVNNDPDAQPDEKLRELNREPTTQRAARAGLLHQGRRHASE